MKKILLLCYVLSQNIAILAQKETDSWICGYYGYEDPDDSLAQGYIFSMKFMNGKRIFNRFKYAKTEINSCNASICDKNGDMMIFFNGEEIFDKNLNPIKGSDSLNYVPKNYPNYQTYYHQSGIILPYPSKKDNYILVYQEKGPLKYIRNDTVYDVSAALKTYYCVIDMTKNNGLGEVVARKKLIIADTLSKGKLSAVRHANGRDWWIISHKFASNTYYKFLLNPQGVKVHDIQTVGKDEYGGLGQTVFSPNGNYYMCFDVTGYGVQSELFPFDRCNGKLAEPTPINFPDAKGCGGAAFSPNGRFIYISRCDTLYQFDLQAKDLTKSKTIIGIYDGFAIFNILKTKMYQLQLAADGKIYISCPNSVPYMHIIHEPDKQGIACQFEQRGLKLPAYHYLNVPNYPNFALRGLIGSPCDTLGLGVATKDFDNQQDIKIFPNPAHDILNVNFAKEMEAEIIVRNITGQILYQVQTNQNTQIPISDIPNGMLLVEIWNKGQRLDTKKIIVLH